METVLISLSCFGQMCNEIDLVQSSENLNEPPSAQNIEVYRNLSEEATKFTAGEYYMKDAFNIWTLSITIKFLGEREATCHIIPFLFALFFWHFF